jgi:hypothetical protein
MMNIRNLVNPTNYIRRLLKNITKDQLLRYIYDIKIDYEPVEMRTEEAETSMTLRGTHEDENVFLDQKEDIFQPIVEIIRGSVKAHDLATTGFGLKGLVDMAVYIIDSKTEEPISKYFCFHLKRIGIFAAGIADGDSTIEVIKMLEIFGETVVNKGLEEASEEATMSLAEVGKAAAEGGLVDATRQAVWSLLVIGTASVEKELKETAEEAANSLAKLTILRKEIVETTISDYEKRLEGLKLKNFQKFKKFMESKEDFPIFRSPETSQL